ncbi:hypothetical protein FJT64_013755 [Amphibalanus amphitrite]|uniref:Uncharacterized protein n=1 Tax=Amphibalanus amphitrite TaxID=1232801 RepID=A0A6A4VE15_AMPAM|nr:hypothetical protein FJT64_013755 [Amphibalanus amphitrite]
MSDSKREFDKRDAEIAALKEEVGTLKQLVTRQAADINDIEQYSRRNILNINGLSETDKEDPVQVGIDLAKSVGVVVQKSDIDRAHRIGTKGKRTATGQPVHRPLLVKFVSYTKREEVYSARRKFKDVMPPRTSCIQGVDLKKIFVTDNLTKANQKVMFRARELRRRGELWAAWSDGCQMKVKIKEGGPTHKIQTEDDLEKLTRQCAAGRPSRLRQLEGTINLS